MRSRRPVALLLVAQAERDVLGDGQRLEHREMLEHHADAQRCGPGLGLAIELASPPRGSRRRRVDSTP